MKAYAALLRGINVGGNNLIKMKDLAACFERTGFSRVRTYIQSGNVVFCTEEADKSRLTGLIEGALYQQLQMELLVVLRSVEEFRDIVRLAPNGFGSDPASYRYDVLFLRAPLTSEEIINSIFLKEGVDQAFGGNEVLYFSRLIARASQSRLTKIVSSRFYRSLTIRNWNTTLKLLELLEAKQD